MLTINVDIIISRADVGIAAIVGDGAAFLVDVIVDET